MRSDIIILMYSLVLTLASIAILFSTYQVEYKDNYTGVHPVKHRKAKHFEFTARDNFVIYLITYVRAHGPSVVSVISI